MDLNEYIKDEVELKRKRDKERVSGAKRMAGLENEIKVYISEAVRRDKDYFQVGTDDYYTPVLDVARKNGWVVEEGIEPRTGGITSYVVYFTNISTHKPVVMNRVKNILLVLFLGIIFVLGMGYMTLKDIIDRSYGG